MARRGKGARALYLSEDEIKRLLGALHAQAEKHGGKYDDFELSLKGKLEEHLMMKHENNSFYSTQASQLLDSYTRFKLIKEDHEKHVTSATERQRSVYQYCINMTEKLERAVSMIDDDQSRQIVEYRYLQGNMRKATLFKFRDINDRTLDRKMKLGIARVAAILVSWEGSGT